MPTALRLPTCRPPRSKSESAIVCAWCTRSGAYRPHRRPPPERRRGFRHRPARTTTSRRPLILFPAGLAAPRRDAPMGLQPGMCELLVDVFRHVATAASAARANVYVAQPADIAIRASLPRPTPGGVGDIGSDNPLEGI